RHAPARGVPDPRRGRAEGGLRGDGSHAPRERRPASPRPRRTGCGGHAARRPAEASPLRGTVRRDLRRTNARCGLRVREGPGGGGTARLLAYTDLTEQVGHLEFTHLTVDVSHSRAELLGVLERNNPGRRIELPPVDYSRQETFLVAVGPRSSPGYALEVVRVQEKGGHAVVVVHERTPSLGDAVQA